MQTISTPREAAVLADDIEAAAFEDMFDAAPVLLREQLGLRVEHVAGATALLASRLPATMFNRVIGPGLHAPFNAEVRDALTALYREAGVGNWWMHWNPQALQTENLLQPDPAAEGLALLLQAGFSHPPRRSWAKLVRDVQTPAAVVTDLVVTALPAGADPGPVCRCIAQVFEMPPFMATWLAALHDRARWRLYAVLDGASIVGGGAMFLDDGLAWLGMGAMAASHRKRGAHRALMARRIRDAQAAGCHHVVTETGEPIADEPNPSLANILRAGFARVASRLNLQGPLPAAGG